MKKIIVAIVTLTILLGLSSCGKSKEVENVEFLISSIGTVDKNSENDIRKAENAYRSLSDKDKNKVDNYNTLLEARSVFNAIPKEIILTTSNIRDYLKFNLEYDNFEVDSILGISFSDIDVVTTIYPIVACDFNNVEIGFEITCPNGIPFQWEVTSSDKAYNKDDTHKMKLCFILPSNGNYTERHRITNSYTSARPKYDCRYSITSVSGTVTLH